jgi:hypothetical protein
MLIKRDIFLRNIAISDAKDTPKGACVQKKKFQTKAPREDTKAQKRFEFLFVSSLGAFV